MEKQNNQSSGKSHNQPNRKKTMEKQNSQSSGKSRNQPNRKKNSSQRAPAKRNREEDTFDEYVEKRQRILKGDQDGPEKPLYKTRQKKYKRGSSVNLKGIKDKKLKTKLQREEELINQSVYTAARNEMLLTEEVGSLESTNPMYPTWLFTQDKIKKAVDLQTANKMHDLVLDNQGPFKVNWTANGRNLLMAGIKGYAGSIDTMNMKVLTELNLNEPIRDACYLHNETVFALAQKNFVYIYDKQGTELHKLSKHQKPLHLQFLPYHFLLASLGKDGELHYQDTTNGETKGTIKTKCFRAHTMKQNPSNAILHIGQHNGVVSLWSPNMNEPLVKMLCHRGPVQEIAIHPNGNIMATSGVDGTLKIWDLRTYQEMKKYFTRYSVTSMDISQTGLLSTAHGSHIQVWKKFEYRKTKAPYLTHRMKKGGQISSLAFRPFEDILGIGYTHGFQSIIVPGAGTANFDSFEANPYQDKKWRREATVHRALEKIPADMITIHNDYVGNLTKTTKDIYNEEIKQQNVLVRKHAKAEPKEKKKARGKNSSSKRVKRKQITVIEQKKQLLEKSIKEQQEEENPTKDQPPTKRAALSRFKK